MNNTPRPKRKRNPPKRYTPDVKPEDLKDDESVDSDWDDDTKFDFLDTIDLKNEKYYDYTSGFVVPDDKPIEKASLSKADKILEKCEKKLKEKNIK